MTPAVIVFCALAARPVLIAQAPVAAPQADAEHITGIRVRGNHTTPDAQVITLAGVYVGDAFTQEMLTTVKARLDKSGRFQSVDVLKRYESLSDPSAILLVIMVEELAGITIDDPEPGPLRRLRANTM